MVENCPVCLERASGPYYERDQRLLKCDTCGFVFESAVTRANLHYEGAYSLEWAEKERWQYPARASALTDIVRRIVRAGGSGRILDVGCGDGHLLHICAGHGFDCVGCEPSRVLASYAAQASGAEVVQGRYELSLFPAASFDVITFVQVLEHISEPRALLRAAWYHLRPGGLLCVEVPSRYAPHFLLYQLTGIRWFVDSPRGVIQWHVGYHHPASVRHMCAAERFREIELTTGRWTAKYHGWKHAVGLLVDPVVNLVHVGGILYLGQRTTQNS